MCGAVRAGVPVRPQSDLRQPEMDYAPHFDALQPGQQMVGAEPIVGTDTSVPPPPLPSGTPRPLRSPKSPSALERERHNVTHLPYRDWCPYCVAGKRPNSPHRKIKRTLDLPMMSADYGYYGETRSFAFLAVTNAPFVYSGAVLLA